MDELIDQLVADGLLKDREDATAVVILYASMFHGMAPFETKCRILSDTVDTLKTKLHMPITSDVRH
jgi:hypothetical protein